MRRLALLSLLLFVTIPIRAQKSVQIKGWLVIHGGGNLTNEVKERVVALAGGQQARFVMIPTAMPDAQIPGRSAEFARALGIQNYAELHTRDRDRANSDAFVDPLRHSSGVWIDGGRQWRLVNAYDGTAVEREIKALLDRGGVVFGSSAGASIQASFLVRGSPGTPNNPDGDNTIMMAPGYEVGFGLLPNSAIDQHVDARGREIDLDPVIVAHPELLGIGIDQSAAIIVHDDSFFVVGGQVAVHDGKKHIGGASYFLLSSGQAYNLKTRTIVLQQKLPMTLTVTSASRTPRASGMGSSTIGVGQLESRETSESERINYQCAVSLYSIGNNVYQAHPDGPHRLKVEAREVDSDKLSEYSCTY
jgi:cyanophycinase